MLFTPPRNASWIELLPDGHQGTWRTLEAMRWLCRKDYQTPFVHAVVAYVVALGSRCGFTPVHAVFNFARDCIRYVEDPPGIEKISSFERTTFVQAGDCDEKCVWLATALLSLDVSTRFVCQSYRGRTWDHVYCEYFDWGYLRWIALDPTADGHTGVLGNPGWRQPLALSGSEMRFEV